MSYYYPFPYAFSATVATPPAPVTDGPADDATATPPAAAPAGPIPQAPRWRCTCGVESSDNAASTHLRDCAQAVAASAQVVPHAAERSDEELRRILADWNERHPTIVTASLVGPVEP